MSIRIGVLLRHEDESGISGTGIVAHIVEFPDGTFTLHWKGETPTTTNGANVKTLGAIHGHGGKTEAVFYDEITPPRNIEELDKLLNPPSEEERDAALAESIACEVAEQLEEQVAKKAARLAIRKMNARKQSNGAPPEENSDG